MTRNCGEKCILTTFDFVYFPSIISSPVSTKSILRRMNNNKCQNFYNTLLSIKLETGRNSSPLVSSMESKIAPSTNSDQPGIPINELFPAYESSSCSDSESNETVSERSYLISSIFPAYISETNSPSSYDGNPYFHSIQSLFPFHSIQSYFHSSPLVSSME